MNGSPSTQSVGSLKPSTAASNASGKRARTIIVARSIPEATMSPIPSSSASSLAGRHSGTGHGTHHHHHKDSKPVKLNSYAALGSESDVELYERFLSEKKVAQHSSDGAAGTSGATSPQMLTKRRTMGQIPLHSNPNTNSDTKLESTPFQDNGDAKQRREAVMQHRKWLKSLPIHERLAYERQQNVLKKWKQINREWEEFKTRTSKKLGKSEKQLVMSRASEYREQIEMYDALQRALPLAEKVGEDFWLVSLRNDGTRYVPVGNIFSGLYCPIRESSKLQPRVRRPLDYQAGLAASAGDEEDDAGGHDKPLTMLERRSMEALAKKKRRLKKQLHALFPHEVEPSQSGQLRVDTIDLFEWASSSQPNEFNDYDNSQLRDPTASTRSLLLPLDEEDQENNADGFNSRRSTARSRQTARARPKRGPSMRVFLDDSLEEEGTGDISDDPLEISFFIDIDVPQQQSLYFENNGSTALQFQWRRVDLLDEELFPRLTKHHPSPLEDPERIAWTSISQREGVVLPGELVEFVFTFQSKRAGTWLEKWLLDVDPPLPGLSSKREAAACVRLQCTAVDNYVPSTQRKKLGLRAAQSQTQFMAEQILKQDIIHKVDPQYAIEFPELDANARLFYDTHRRGAFESVQYSPRLVAQCHELYAAALAVLQPTPAVVVVADEIPPSTPTGTTPRETLEPSSTSAAVYPLEWDLKLMTLKDVVVAADALLESQYLALKAQQIAERQTQGADADDEDEEEEEDLMEKLLGTKARKKEEQAAALRALEPHFHDDFQSLVLAAQISPYEPRLLTETLAEKLASMAGETPVVLEIAQMQSHSQSRGLAEEDACALLKPLLVRAMDESFVIDQQREKVFEDARREFHSIALSQKKSFADLPALVSESSSLLSPRGRSVVIFLQVDLDIANWFTLSTASDESFLEWKLSQKLLDHDTYVPPKIQAAAASVDELLQTLATSGTTPVVVLITELSPPPMNKATKKAEVAFATNKATANKASSDAGDPPAPPSTATIEATRQKLEQKRNKQLSLRGVDTVLRRAMASQNHGLAIEFMASLEELSASCQGVQAMSSDGTDVESEVDSQQPPQARIILLEHLGVLARQALKKPDATSAATATTSPPVVEKGKAAAPPSAADKKKSVVAMPVAPAPKETDDDDDDQIDVLPGMSLEMMAAQALGQRLAQLGHVLVVDFFPQSWWEATFVYFTAAPSPAASRPQSSDPNEDSATTEAEAEGKVVPKHVVVGPQLLQTFAAWQSLFQPSLMIASPATAPMTAVVGGRGLERKLRLIDGLLERVDAIYVVGELAMSIFRVLHTKQVIKSVKRERKPVPRFEWQRLVAPVERLMQKAYRKQVELLLPLDFVVGDTRVDLDAETIAADDDGDDDEAEEEEDEEEDEDEDDDDDGKARKKKAKPKVRVQKPLNEPPEVDTWQPRSSYEGERGVVEAKTSSSSSWVRFADVTLETISNATVVDGNQTLLEAADGAEDVESSAVVTSPKPVVLAELDWTHRVFDIGPISTRILLEKLQRDPGWLFVNGTLGVVEFREFDTGTKALLHAVQSTPQLTESLLLTGKSTVAWLRRLSQPTAKPPPGWTGVLSSSAAKNATVLSYIVETKQHAMLTAFDSI